MFYNRFPIPTGAPFSDPTSFYVFWDSLIVPLQFKECLPVYQQIKWLYEKKSPLIVAGDNVGIVEQEDGSLKINVTDTSYGSNYEMIEMVRIPEGFVKGYNLINSDTGEEKGVAILIPDQHYDDTEIKADITSISADIDKKNPLLREGTNVDIVDNSDGTQTISVNGITLSVAVASTTTIAAGQNARVENVGTSENVRLAFYIPRGADGQPGSDGQDGAPGFSPIATVTKSGNTATITITDINGTTTAQVSDGADGTDGQDGAPGFSPTATVTKSGDTATITITDENGTTTAQVSDGTDGQDGTPGFSPTASVTKVGHTATITITDENGTTTADITDGTGDPGYSPSASVSKVGDTATITITDENGTTTAQVSDGTDGTDGQDGAPGFSPTATVTKSGDTATITITDENGTTTAQVSDGADGNDGAPGFSPTATVTKSGGTATITITDENGTTTTTISDGADGQNGAPGFSPTASVSKVGGTATITVTDENGTTTCNITDGQDGAAGAQGPVGPAGPTKPDSAEYTTLYVGQENDGMGNIFGTAISNGSQTLTINDQPNGVAAIIRYGGNGGRTIDIPDHIGFSINTGGTSLTLTQNSQRSFTFENVRLVPGTFSGAQSQYWEPKECAFTKTWYQPIAIVGRTSGYATKYNHWMACITWHADYTGIEGDTNMGDMTITLLAPNSGSQAFPEGFTSLFNLSING